jgi:hypothetical protein
MKLCKGRKDGLTLFFSNFQYNLVWRGRVCLDITGIYNLIKI